MRLSSKGPGWPKGMKGDFNRKSRMAGFFGQKREVPVQVYPNNYGGPRFPKVSPWAAKDAANN